MHYRVRGNNVRLVKAAVDPATNKFRSVPVDTVILITDELSACARMTLSNGAASADDSVDATKALHRMIVRKLKHDATARVA